MDKGLSPLDYRYTNSIIILWIIKDVTTFYRAMVFMLGNDLLLVAAPWSCMHPEEVFIAE